MNIIDEITKNKKSIARYPGDAYEENVFSSPLLSYNNMGKMENYGEEIKSKLIECLGDMPNFSPTWTEEYRKEQKDFIEIRYIIEVEKDCFMPALLLVPKAKANAPVVICVQGHGKGMQLSVGRPYRLKDLRKIKEDRDFGLQAIANGYAALVIEQRYLGERKSKIANCNFSAERALIAGRTSIGERIWDIRKAIDFLQTRTDVDGTKIGIVGNSGGGTALYYASCLEPRISIAMPGCSICTYRESIIRRQHCCCNYIPSIAKYFDMGDLSYLIAPRYLVVVAGEKDPLFRIEGVKEAYKTISSIYNDRGVADNCAIVIGKGKHRFYREGWTYFNQFAKKEGWL